MFRIPLPENEPVAGESRIAPVNIAFGEKRRRQLSDRAIRHAERQDVFRYTHTSMQSNDPSNEEQQIYAKLENFSFNQVFAPEPLEA